MEARSPREMSKKLVDNIFILFKRIDRCAIVLVDSETNTMKTIIYRSRKPVEDPKKVFNQELVRQALILNKPVMVKDSNIMEYEDDKVTESLHLMKIRSAMCVPITGYFGVRGGIYVDSLERLNGFRTSGVALLKDVSGRASLAMDNMLLRMSYNLE